DVACSRPALSMAPPPTPYTTSPAWETDWISRTKLLPLVLPAINYTGRTGFFRGIVSEEPGLRITRSSHAQLCAHDIFQLYKPLCSPLQALFRRNREIPANAARKDHPWLQMITKKSWDFDEGLYRDHPWLLRSCFFATQKGAARPRCNRIILLDYN